MKQPITSRNPDVMGGTVVFSGTRVPVQTLFDYLKVGKSIDDFLEVLPVCDARAGRRFPGGGEGPSNRSAIVKIFLDEARDIIGHDVKTARQMGWTAIKVGELLSLASKHFDVSVTTDRNLSFQQNLASFSIAVIVLKTRISGLSYQAFW